MHKITIYLCLLSLNIISCVSEINSNNIQNEDAAIEKLDSQQEILMLHPPFPENPTSTYLFESLQCPYDSLNNCHPISTIEYILHNELVDVYLDKIRSLCNSDNVNERINANILLFKAGYQPLEQLIRIHDAIIEERTIGFACTARSLLCDQINEEDNEYFNILWEYAESDNELIKIAYIPCLGLNEIDNEQLNILEVASRSINDELRKSVVIAIEKLISTGNLDSELHGWENIIKELSYDRVHEIRYRAVSVLSSFPEEQWCREILNDLYVNGVEDLISAIALEQLILISDNETAEELSRAAIMSGTYEECFVGIMYIRQYIDQEEYVEIIMEHLDSQDLTIKSYCEMVLEEIAIE